LVTERWCAYLFASAALLCAGVALLMQVPPAGMLGWAAALALLSGVYFYFAKLRYGGGPSFSEEAADGGVPGPERIRLTPLARYVDLPARQQQGPTCGLNALGMVMDYWHGLGRQACVEPLMQGHGFRLGTERRCYRYTCPSTETEQLLAEGVRRGMSVAGEIFDMTWLGELAQHWQYRARILRDPDMEFILGMLRAGRPLLVCYDTDAWGYPALRQGERLHYGVLTGYLYRGDVLWLLARQSRKQPGRDQWWRADDFLRSSRQLHTTSYYVGASGIPPRLQGHVRDGELALKQRLAGCALEVVPARMDYLPLS
jgi:hypothetical protein